MPVNVYYDVFCDGCVLWVHTEAKNRSGAKREALAGGWQFPRGSLLAFCPDCATSNHWPDGPPVPFKDWPRYGETS